MSEAIWNNVYEDVEDVEDDRDIREGATAVVNGVTLSLETGANFKSTILNLARDAGYGKFKVYMNGNELKVSEAPDLIIEGTSIRITPFDSAA